MILIEYCYLSWPSFWLPASAVMPQTLFPYKFRQIATGRLEDSSVPLDCRSRQLRSICTFQIHQELVSAFVRDLNAVMQLIRSDLKRSRVANRSPIDRFTRINPVGVDHFLQLVQAYIPASGDSPCSTARSWTFVIRYDSTPQDLRKKSNYFTRTFYSN